MKTSKEAFIQYYKLFYPELRKLNHHDLEDTFNEGIDFAQRWITLEEEKPPYYKPVLVKYKSADHENISCCWLAVDDNGFYCWTVNNTNHVLNSKSVISWRPINIE